MTATTTEASVPHARVKSQTAIQDFARLRAPFSLRCGAFLVDYITLVAILAFSTLVSRMLGGGARSWGSSSETVGLILALLFAVFNLAVLPALTGLTVGKWAAGLRIVCADGSPIGIRHALLRHFVGYPVSIITLGLGFLGVALSARGRGLHDLIAGTIVIREEAVTTVSRRRR